MYNNYGYSLNHGYWGFFAQDQWRITSKLTLNYGLRWDFESGLQNVINTDYTALQPRVGLAWSPDRKTVIRAGYGLFTDRNNMVGGCRRIGVCDSDPRPLAYPSLLGGHRTSLLRKNMQADGHSADRVLTLAYGQVPRRQLRANFPNRQRYG